MRVCSVHSTPYSVADLEFTSARGGHYWADRAGPTFSLPNLGRRRSIAPNSMYSRECKSVSGPVAVLLGIFPGPDKFPRHLR